MPLITKRNSNGTYTTFTEKEYHERNGLLIAGGLFLVLLVFGFITIKNILSFETLAEFGPDLYFRNITHFHTDSAIKLHRRTYLFADRRPIEAAESGQGAIATLGGSQNLIFKGQFPSSASTWLAVQGFDGEKRVLGWLWLPCDDGGRDSRAGIEDRLCWEAQDRLIADQRKEVIASRIKDAVARAGIQINRVGTGLEFDRYKESAAASGREEIDARLLGGDAYSRLFVDKSKMAAFKAIRDRAEEEADHALFAIQSMVRPVSSASAPRTQAPAVAAEPIAALPTSPAPPPQPAPASEPPAAEQTALQAIAQPVAQQAAEAVQQSIAESESQARQAQVAGGVLPSFDCAKATLIAEALVCSNADLAEADLRMGQAYKTLVDNAASAEDAARIKSRQRVWLAGRRNVCDNADCLRDAYHNRIRLLASESN